VGIVGRRYQVRRFGIPEFVNTDSSRRLGSQIVIFSTWKNSVMRRFKGNVPYSLVHFFFNPGVCVCVCVCVCMCVCVCVCRTPHLGNIERVPVRLDSMFTPTALSQEKTALPTPPFCHERYSRVRVPHFRTWKYDIVETLWITSRRLSV
jgi:hypothetical protein